MGGKSANEKRTGTARSLPVEATLSTAAATGLTQGKKGKQLSTRVHETLFEAAAAKSGLRGTQLIDYALAKVALEDDFADRLISLKGTIPGTWTLAHDLTPLWIVPSNRMRGCIQ
jgi:hypothetical protein